MEVYIIIIALLVVFSLVYDFNIKKQGSEGFYYLMLVLLVALAGFRGDIGSDTITYHSWFNSLPTDFVKAINYNRFEPLFVIVSVIIKRIFGSWLAAQIIYAFILNASLFWFIKKHTDFKFLAVLLYFISSFYFLNCEEMRQATGFAFILIGSKYIGASMYDWKYFLFVAIAIGFHYSSFLFLLLPFIPNVFDKKKWVLLSLVISSLAAIYIGNNFSEIVMSMDLFLGFTDFSHYTDSAYAEMGERTVMNYVNNITIKIIIPLVLYYIGTHGKSNFHNWFFISLLVSIGNLNMLIFYRYSHLLTIVSSIVLCRAFSAAYINISSFVIRLFLAFSLAITIYATIGLYMNYNTFLEGYFYENFIPYTTFTE